MKQTDSSLAQPMVAQSGALSSPRPKPQYGWLVFGTQARLRVLVCLDGEAVTLEPYADGKPTGRKEYFADCLACKDVSLADLDGKTSYVITRMSGQVVQAGEPTEMLVTVHIKGPLDYLQYCGLVEMTGDPETAPLAHFHGPLKVEALTINWKLPPTLTLQRGDKPTDLKAIVGTMDAKKGCWVVVKSQPVCYRGEGLPPAFPPSVHPFADVEFQSLVPGGPPVRKQYPLDQTC